jgi:hypothetical protein
MLPIQSAPGLVAGAMTVSTHTALAAGYRAHNVRLPAAERKWWAAWAAGCSHASSKNRTAGA